MSSGAVILLYVLSDVKTTYRTITYNQICGVTSVTDGDSIIVNCNEKLHNLRLMHIDSPEISQNRFGTLAKKSLKSMARNDVLVNFFGKDIYGRDLAIIYSLTDEKKSINIQQVQRGLARVYTQYNPPQNYKVAMKQAKKEKMGIWQFKGLHQDPMRFRRLSK